MKNREKYAEEIKKNKISHFCTDFIKPHILKSNNCDGMTCEQCRMVQLLWLEEEYTEPIIDWSKVYTWYGEEKLDYARILTNAEAEKWDKWKDLEEHGRLIELPCEKVYCIMNYNSPKYAFIDSIPIETMSIYDLKHIDNGNIFFSTKEKAKAKLEERRMWNE